MSPEIHILTVVPDFLHIDHLTHTYTNRGIIIYLIYISGYTSYCDIEGVTSSNTFGDTYLPIEGLLLIFAMH